MFNSFAFLQIHNLVILMFITYERDDADNSTFLSQKSQKPNTYLANYSVSVFRLS